MDFYHLWVHVPYSYYGPCSLFFHMVHVLPILPIGPILPILSEGFYSPILYTWMALCNCAVHGYHEIIDFSINGLRTENWLRSQLTPTPNKINVINRKLIDSLIRMELTREISMPRFSNFLRNSIIHFRMFLYFETCFLRVVVSLLCRLQAVAKTHFPILSRSN